MADIEGLHELLDALEETSINLVDRRKLIAKALRAAGKLVSAEAQRRIPVDTGAARASMSVSVIEQTAQGAEAQIGPKLFYVKFAEFGTSRQTARPWLGPAYDATEDDAFEKIAEILGDGIEESFLG